MNWDISARMLTGRPARAHSIPRADDIMIHLIISGSMCQDMHRDWRNVPISEQAEALRRGSSVAVSWVYMRGAIYPLKNRTFSIQLSRSLNYSVIQYGVQVLRAFLHSDFLLPLRSRGDPIEAEAYCRVYLIQQCARLLSPRLEHHKRHYIWLCTLPLSHSVLSTLKTISTDSNWI
jgi:hypothetical protein